MIFVTVGSTRCDKLIKAVDGLGLKHLVCQIGSGEYKPKNGVWFRYAPSLTDYFELADLLVITSGAGSIFEALDAGVPTVSVKDSFDIGNYGLAEKLAEGGYLAACYLHELGGTIKQAEGMEFTAYEAKGNRIADEIVEGLK